MGIYCRSLYFWSPFVLFNQQYRVKWALNSQFLQVLVCLGFHE